MTPLELDRLLARKAAEERGEELEPCDGYEGQPWRLCSKWKGHDGPCYSTLKGSGH